MSEDKAPYIDFNNYTLAEKVEMLRKKYQFLSTGEANSICSLIDFYDRIINATVAFSEGEELLKAFSKAHVHAMHGCNRVEVVDQTGRAYVNRKDDNFVEASLQDGGRTLKIFIS